MFQRLKAAYRSFFDNPSNWQYIGLAAGSRPTLAGVPLDEASALSHLPIYAAVNRIASDMALLDITLEQQTANGRTVAINDPLFRPLTFSPDGVRTSKAWRRATLGHLLTRGNSYNEIEFDEAGNVVGWHLLDPTKVEPRFDDNEQLVYDVQRERGKGRVTLPAWKVLHFAGHSPEGIKGYSPIALARETLAIGKAVDLFGASFFGQSARPSGMLKKAGTISDAARKNLRESFAELHSGPMNAGRVVILEEGMEFAPWTIPPEDAQFLQTKKLSIEDVARLYGLPPFKIGDYTDAHFSNFEEASQDYLQSTLLNWCGIIESEIEFKCLAPEQHGTFNVRHDFKPLLRPNAAARSAYYNAGLDRGWLTRNEVRNDEGLAPIVGGDNRMLPLNFMVEKPDGTFVPSPAPTPAPTPPPTTDTKSVDAVAGIVRAELARSLRREAATLKRAAAKPGFLKAIDEIYADHESYLVETLGPSVHALNVTAGKKLDARTMASDWIATSRRQLAELYEVTTSDQRPAAVDDLCRRWEARIAEVTAA